MSDLQTAHGSFNEPNYRYLQRRLASDMHGEAIAGLRAIGPPVEEHTNLNDELCRHVCPKRSGESTYPISCLLSLLGNYFTIRYMRDLSESWFPGYVEGADHYLQSVGLTAIPESLYRHPLDAFGGTLLWNELFDEMPSPETVGHSQ